MRHRLSPWSCLLLCLPLLPSCSSYSPPDALASMSREEVVARMGPPDTERRMDAGSRLEFPRGPYGKHTWFVYFDAAGRASRAEQVLTERNFSRIDVGMTQEEVRQLLGRPGEVQMLGRGRGVVWSYRYENSFCNWFQVELSLQQKVRSAGYGQPPECQARDDRSDR
ncbi:outer membrane protein assembly factor BamE [Rhodoferax sp.]|uniref:outer membrane protein assembly factor BamE domain-containing protein n=1 Tax=Rhodoferax sp. TaxID=50421 RepID=UPI002721B386|nr:outer membrane protein assembly factor BamE [Rhodoferax sp.]MDO9198889.1 outer membrane protein assembly factor BamE [Rhodoferax sp.]